MTNLDAFLLRGPPGGDVTAGLADLRYNVLVNGIPSNQEGMVSLISSIIKASHNAYIELLLTL
jgi:hypothetical protein